MRPMDKEIEKLYAEFDALPLGGNVPSFNGHGTVVMEQCATCHREVAETVSGTCLECAGVTRVTDLLIG